MISIIIPYLKSSGAIDLCLEKIKENTKEPYELILVEDSKDVYGAFNDSAEKAKGDVLVFLNDDMVVAPGWETNLVKYCDRKTIVTNYLVEPGVVGVNEKNIKLDLGTCPTEFNQEEFLAFCDEASKTTPEVLFNAFGWFMPFAVDKRDFIPYPNREKFPAPNDVKLFGALSALEYSFVRVNSFTYHFQCLSHR